MGADTERGQKVEQSRRWAGYAAVGAGLLAIAGGVGARRRRSRFRFDAGYREEVRLRNGDFALVRLIRPTDKRLLAAGMRRLSAEGRYRRFLVPKNDLTRAELRYFTEVDTLNHFAIGAKRRGGKGEGLGVARFVRLSNRPDTAEFAVVVADEAQRQGLGKLLLMRLADAARERGIRTFTCEVLASNKAFLGLLKRLFPSQIRRYQGPTVAIEMRI